VNPTSPLKPSEPHKSVLAAEIEAQVANRPCTIYPIGVIFGLGSKPIRKVAVRINLKDEEDRAVVQAHRYVNELASDVDAVKTDEAILLDAKARHALFEAFREVETKQTPNGEEDTVTKWPAFPGSGWLAKNATTDQIGALLNLYNQTRAEQSGWFDALDPDTVNQFLNIAADAAGDPLTEKLSGNALAKVMLAQMPREQMQMLLETAAMRLRAAEAEIERLRALAPVAEPAQ
jgi:hypothetical protein